MKSIFISLLSLLLLTQCGSPVRRVEIKAGKAGGLYELSETGKVFKFYGKEESFRLDTITYVPLSDFERMQEEKADYEGQFLLNFKLNDTGTTKFKLMSEKNIGRQLCLVIDDQVMAAPSIQSPISNGLVSLSITDRKGIDSIIRYLEK